MRDLLEPTLANVDKVAVNPGMHWFVCPEYKLSTLRSSLYAAVKRGAQFNISTQYDRKTRVLRVTISDE